MCKETSALRWMPLSPFRFFQCWQLLAFKNSWSMPRNWIVPLLNGELWHMPIPLLKTSREKYHFSGHLQTGGYSRSKTVSNNYRGILLFRDTCEEWEAASGSLYQPGSCLGSTSYSSVVAPQAWKSSLLTSVLLFLSSSHYALAFLLFDWFSFYSIFTAGSARGKPLQWLSKTSDTLQHKGQHLGRA